MILLIIRIIIMVADFNICTSIIFSMKIKINVSNIVSDDRHHHCQNNWYE